MKVKVVESTSTYGLETEINEIIRRNSNDEIVDIKYKCNGGASLYEIRLYSAMIIFKKV